MLSQVNIVVKYILLIFYFLGPTDQLVSYPLREHFAQVCFKSLLQLSFMQHQHSSIGMFVIYKVTNSCLTDLCETVVTVPTLTILVLVGKVITLNHSHCCYNYIVTWCTMVHSLCQN